MSDVAQEVHGPVKLVYQADGAGGDACQSGVTEGGTAANRSGQMGHFPPQTANRFYIFLEINQPLPQNRQCFTTLRNISPKLILVNGWGKK